MDYALGTDTSRYESPVNFKLGVERGLTFCFTRGTVGDYYVDPTLAGLHNGYQAAGTLASAYLVTTPRDVSGIHPISAASHLDLFLNATNGLKPDLKWVVDAELTRGASVSELTTLHKEIVLGLFNATGRFPIIYTRQSWWDSNIRPDPLWAQCDLWAARYKNLTGPWSDGYCKFRDWSQWTFWQYTANADGKYWGMADAEADLDYFNGTREDLYRYAGRPYELTTSQKVDVLWREAKANGWNLTP